MKTERMVLLVTPEEKARITKGAAALGISASEFVRRAVEFYDTDDLAAIEEIEALLPQLDAMAERIEREAAERDRRREEHEAARTYYASDAYREEVRQQLLNDPNIDWERARQVFLGGERQKAA